MIENFEFEGVGYSVNLSEDKKGNWSWSYTTQDGHFEALNERPLSSRAIALSEAKDNAQWYIKNKKK